MYNIYMVDFDDFYCSDAPSAAVFAAKHKLSKKVIAGWDEKKSKLFGMEVKALPTELDLVAAKSKILLAMVDQALTEGTKISEKNIALEAVERELERLAPVEVASSSDIIAKLKALTDQVVEGTA